MAVVTMDGDHFLIEVDPRDPIEVQSVKSLPLRKWDPSTKAWEAPVNRENFEALEALGWLPDSVDLEPDELASAVHVGTHRRALLLKSPPSKDCIARCKRIPDRRFWKPELGGWVVQATTRNLQYLVEAFPEASWDKKAAAERDRVLGVKDEAKRLAKRKETLEGGNGAAAPVDYRFHPDFPPYDHQSHAFALSRDAEAFALLMEMGTGKTRVIVDTAVYLKAKGKLRSVLVICPNSIKDPWDEEIRRMTPPWARQDGEVDVKVWNATMGTRAKRELQSWIISKEPTPLVRWLVMNVETLSHKSGQTVAQDFVNHGGPVMVVADESSRIKTPSAKRTKAAIKLGQRAAFRRIMSGTPVTQGPLDYFAQFQFLDPRILGFNSFYSFRNHFAEMGGWEGKEVVGYKNLEELQGLVGPFSYRVLRRDCMDLPPKVYETRYVDLNDNQAKLYRQMADRMVAEHEGKRVTATIVLTQMMRLQQIVGGFLPPDPVDPMDPEEVKVDQEPTPIPGTNPKMEALLELADDVPGKMIVWARFRPELDIIAKALREKHGPASVVEFHGGISTEERTEGRLAFQDPDSPVRFFVGQTETGGMGITLTEAQTVVYFSNSFSLESRLQSEDRAHRAGQKRTVMYVDLVARATLDTSAILPALRTKKNMADMVTGDDLVKWI